MFDRETGLVTALMRLAPGAVLPDHEHVKIEQTYMLEGNLVDKEGPVAGLEVKPGEFVWREPGSRHKSNASRTLSVRMDSTTAVWLVLDGYL